MKAKQLLICVLCACAAILASAGAQVSQNSYREAIRQQHVTWVAESLKQMKAVKPGMTRADLLNVFETEGGLSTGLQRTYVYRECPYFKVDVEFDAVGRPARDDEGRVTLEERSEDTISRISGPYLEFSVVD